VTWSWLFRWTYEGEASPSLRAGVNDEAAPLANTTSSTRFKPVYLLNQHLHEERRSSVSIEMAENVNYNSHGYAASGERFSTSSCSTSTSTTTSFEWVPTALRRPLVSFGGMAIGGWGFGGLSRQNRADVGHPAG
jgi:hypothetical protein